MDEDRSISCSEAGKLGGAKRKLTADYAELGRKGGEMTKERYGNAHYAEIGYHGGCATRDRRGPQFFEAIGKKGGQRVRELIEKGRASENG